MTSVFLVKHWVFLWGPFGNSFYKWIWCDYLNFVKYWLVQKIFYEWEAKYQEIRKVTNLEIQEEASSRDTHDSSPLWHVKPPASKASYLCMIWSNSMKLSCKATPRVVSINFHINVTTIVCWFGPILSNRINNNITRTTATKTQESGNSPQVENLM